MSTHKNIDRICVAALVLSLLLTIVFANGEAMGIQAADKTMGYENRLFDTSRVHTLDIVMDDWDTFIQTAQSEEYTACSVVIDGEAFKNVGIRGKGNTSLSTVSSMDSERYSFKIEFDQYDTGKTYHGLDKLSLNNVIQDTTYMKDYLTYRLMNEFGAAAPLCSYVYITVNGEDWGLYLAVEGVEDAFLQRNYGSSYGELYKPDSMNFGGGRGNGKDFSMDDFMASAGEETAAANSQTANAQPTAPGGFDPSSMTGGAMPENTASASDSADTESRGRTSRRGFPMEIDEEALRAALEAQEIDPAILDGIDFSGITMDTIQDVLSQLEDVNLQALMEAVMGSGAIQTPDRGGFGAGSGDAKLQYIDDDPDSYSTIFDSAKTDITDADKTRMIEALKTLSTLKDVEDVLDIDAVLRYFVVHNFVVNGDSYTGSMIHNYYLYEEDGKLSMLPWDYNLAYGTFQGSDADSAVNDPIDTPLSVTGSGDRPIVDWIYANEEYTQLYHQYLAQFLETVDATVIIDETAQLIAPYVEKDPTKFYTYEQFETGVTALREFCRLRTESIQGQLDGTIPSTSDGQQNDSSSLIDASHLTTSDMGSMNMGGGRGGNDFPGGGFGGGRGGGTQTSPSGTAADGANQTASPKEQLPTPPDTMTMPARSSAPEGFSSQMPQDPFSSMPSAWPGNSTVINTSDEAERSDEALQTSESASRNVPADFPGISSTAAPNSSAAPLLIVSAAALLIGLIAAFAYRRRF